MRWKVGPERVLYEDKWIHVGAADVELPDGRHLDHRLIRTAAPGAGLAIVSDHAVLLLWRHRFITDTWGWEIPQGSMRPGEDPADAAAREAEEETGWRAVRPLQPLVYTQPSPGLMTSEHHIFLATGATHMGPPRDGFESTKIGWVPLVDVPKLIAERSIVAGTTLVALLYLLAVQQPAIQGPG